MYDVAGYRGFLLAVILSLLPPLTGIAQVPQVVQVGQLYGLGVIPDPGDTYVWNVFKDHTLLELADSTEVVFPSGKTGSAVPVIWLKEGTWYFTVVAINDEGCSNIKVGMLKVAGYLKQTATISIFIDQNPICAGTPVMFTAQATNQGKIPVYTWLKNGFAVGSNKPCYTDSTLVDRDVIKCLLKPTSVIKSDAPVIVESNEIVVTVYTTVANFSFVESIDKYKGEIRLVNESTGADQYSWDFGNGQTSNEESPTITYFDDGIYLISLVASNQLNCTDTMVMKYRMMFKGLYIPNAFAPMASSELPGVFKPAGTNLRSYSIEIYDNWGHLLWQSTALDENGAPSESWDGKVNGKLMPMDTYLWKVNAEFRDGTVWTGSDIGKGPGQTIGTVTLLR